MPQRVIISASFFSWIVLAGTSTWAQEGREALSEPVYHVSKSEEIPGKSAPLTGERGPAPILANALLKSESVPAGPEPTAEPAEDLSHQSPAERKLHAAVSDARQILTNIREEIRDYECLFIKRERVNGKVLPYEFIQLKVRSEQVQDGRVVVPFSVYMKFLKPNNVRNREVLYVKGQNNNKMLAKEGSGIKRTLPSFWLKLDSSFVTCTNRYPICEVGVENLTQRLIDRSVDDRNIDVCDVRYESGAKIDGRLCRYLEVVRPTPKVGPDAKFGMNVYLAQVFIDEELNIPIRYAAYDWPRNGENKPEVIEEYTYKNLRLNVGLKDSDFNPKNPKYNF